MRKGIVALAALILAVGVAAALRDANPRPRFEPAEVIGTYEAVYPVNAVYWGTVVLQVTIAEDGSVADVKVVREVKGLTDEALKAIRKWKFKPARIDGDPVRSTVPVAFSFTRPAVWWPTTPPQPK